MDYLDGSYSRPEIGGQAIEELTTNTEMVNGRSVFFEKLSKVKVIVNEILSVLDECTIKKERVSKPVLRATYI